jgi:hypothetical protein
VRLSGSEKERVYLQTQFDGLNAWRGPKVIMAVVGPIPTAI